MKPDEYPPLFLRIWALIAVPFTLLILGVGVFYVVTGNGAGKVIGVVIVVITGLRLSVLVRAIAGR